MGRKKTNPGIYLYPHDILSSPRCRSLTPGGAGIYFFLFLRLCDPPVPGAYRLHDWEPHPKWQKSDTRKCLAIADKRERLPLFAKWLAKNDLPWTKNEVLPYIQELYDRGIIIIEGDMLIQPRLYVDSGFEIPDIDHDGDPIGSILDDPVSGQMRAFDNTLQGGLNLKKNKGTKKGTENSTKKGTEKGTKKHRVSERDAGAPLNRVGVGDNIIKDNKRGVGETDDDPTGFWEFWQAYNKKRTPDSQHWINIERVIQEWEALTDEERSGAMAFIPAYVKATPTKKWRMHPATFLQEKAWLTIEIDGGKVVNPKTDEITPETAQIPTKGDAAGELSTQGEKRAQKPREGQNRATVADNPPTLEDVQAYFDERTKQGKPFLYITPDGFYDACCQSGWMLKDGKPMMDWRARCRTFESFRKEHGDRPAGTPHRSARRTDDTPKQVKDENFDGMETW